MKALQQSNNWPVKKYGKGIGMGKGRGKGKDGPYGKKEKPAKSAATKMPNYKAQIVQYISKKYKREPTAEELVFKFEKDEPTNQWKCHAHLKVGENEDFEAWGDLHEDKRVAEKLACSEMLMIIDPELNERAVKFKEAELSGAYKLSEEEKVAKRAQKLFEAVGPEPKGRLNQILIKIAGRNLDVGDCVYSTRAVVGGFQSRCEIKFKNETYVGEVRPDKRSAEKAAADTVIELLREEAGELADVKPMEE